MNRGYTKLWRKLRNHEIMSDAHALQLFINLLLNAAWNKSQHEMRGQKICLEPGEVIFGRRSFAHKLMSTERNIRSALAKLVRLDMVTVKDVTKRYSIISIVNWKKYQGSLESFDEDDCPTETVDTVGQDGKVRPTDDSKMSNNINVSHRTTHRTTHRNDENCPTDRPTDCPTENVDTVGQTDNSCPTDRPTERPTESQKTVPQNDPQTDHIEEDIEDKEKDIYPPTPPKGGSEGVESDSSNQSSVEPEKKRRKRKQVDKEDKPVRGKNGLVRLTDDECWKLTAIFNQHIPGRGKELALKAIEELDFWFSNNPSKHERSKDHMRSMHKWVITAVLESEARMAKAQHDLQRFGQGSLLVNTLPPPKNIQKTGGGLPPPKNKCA